jgi:ribosomal protein S18 acetylase RimI-like enzyme
MKNKIEIRASISEDALEVERLRIRCWKKHYAGIIDETFLSKLDPEKSYMARQAAILSQKDINLVAVLEGKIIGLSDGGKSRLHQENRLEREVHSLYVDVDFRRQGVGGLLFQEQCNLLRQRGFERISIWALKENLSARNFYEKLNGTRLEHERSIEVDGKDYLHVIYQWYVKKN